MALIRWRPPGLSSASWPLSARYFNDFDESLQSETMIFLGASTGSTEVTLGLKVGSPLVTNPLEWSA
ncbi:ligand-gated ion channel [Kibdelosporangium aridum]|uniref:hypothetical protein n=1 Tax=Kibdelosporangium aridum TaxID=2030 RepID=UPI00135AFDFE|nr:hypothetical protein [Kibdelosporangium aridum]